MPKFYILFRNLIFMFLYVTEFVKGGELFMHLCTKGSFDIHSAKFYIAELVVAIDSVHKVNVLSLCY